MAAAMGGGTVSKVPFGFVFSEHLPLGVITDDLDVDKAS